MSWMGKLADQLAAEREGGYVRMSAVVDGVDDEGRTWVRLAGSDLPIPVHSTAVSVSADDAVTVIWKNGRVYIEDNASDPSASSSALRAVGRAVSDVEAHVAELQDELGTYIADVAAEIDEDNKALWAENERLWEKNGDITSDLDAVIKKADDNAGNTATLALRVDGIASRISDAEGNISGLTQDARGIATRVSNAEGNISGLTQTASSLGTRISDAEGNVSSLTQTVNGFSASIGDAAKTATNFLQYTTVNGVGTVRLGYTGMARLLEMQPGGLTVRDGDGNSLVAFTENGMYGVVMSGFGTRNVSLSANESYKVDFYYYNMQDLNGQYMNIYHKAFRPYIPMKVTVGTKACKVKGFNVNPTGWNSNSLPVFSVYLTTNGCSDNWAGGTYAVNVQVGYIRRADEDANMTETDESD